MEPEMTLEELVQFMNESEGEFFIQVAFTKGDLEDE